VENAIKELKLKADGIIGRNTEDSIALWIKEKVEI
jgi:hydroxymethylpyrimidine pyrophosphatase-like HAD family hydrolase